ncbi:aminotransferase class I/II-fold pyridoxal phosphate-dependent enzyme [Solirubrobacter soli]|uniref:aminotransferase class I/II-fold pyridoxal phosphate-dependent enzyme n=1 Tax=Solirubrobacter soli TaxID=363832 RepID=UPI0003FFC352|nr:aminotransferase class I/II-fold pyridoxal phosphate-dependent enzyme [Solirubrobacter soli]
MKRLFGYYRQFDELSPEEVSRELLERRDEERRRHPVGLPPLDLSGAALHLAPHAEAINAATFALRRAANSYPDASALREAIAASHGIAPARVMIGHGAGELLRAALRAVATDTVEIVWPGWGLLPQLVSEAGATPVPVSEVSGTRTAVSCRPNDPTGAVPDVAPGDAWLILDEALAGFADLDVIDHPRVIQVRSFSKVHALAGLRIGYAIVPEDGPSLTPALGVGAPALAAARWAVENGGEAAARRAAQVAEQRARLAAEFPVAPGVGPYAWLELPVAEELAARRIYVAPGSAWGDERHVRVTLGDAASTDRLLAALREL